MMAVNESLSATLAVLGEEDDDVLRAVGAPGLADVRADGVGAAGVGDVEDDRVGSAGGVDERLVDLRSHPAAADDDDGAARRADLDRAVGERPRLEGSAESFGSRRGLLDRLGGEREGGGVGEKTGGPRGGKG